MLGKITRQIVILWCFALKSDSQFILPFAKLHGLGNDFIFVDAGDLEGNALGQSILLNWRQCVHHLANALCQRQFAIGADGLILVLDLSRPRQQDAARTFFGSAYQSADLAWIYTNSDGSPSDMCGNGLRCLGLWAHDRASVGQSFAALTLSGIVEISYYSPNEIKVVLGEPKLAAEFIPYIGATGCKNIIKEPFIIDGKTFYITCVNIGNPHCVIFAEDFREKYHVKLPVERNKRDGFFPSELQALASLIQRDGRFPESTNVEFAWVKSLSSVETIVWERGCGATLACGSGAMAVLVAGVLEGRLSREAAVTLPGGTLRINWSETDNKIRMIGPAEEVFVGQIALPEAIIKTVQALPTQIAPKRKSDCEVKTG
jgi:diaminopimelate epimerase